MHKWMSLNSGKLSLKKRAKIKALLGVNEDHAKSTYICMKCDSTTEDTTPSGDILCRDALEFVLNSIPNTPDPQRFEASKDFTERPEQWYFVKKFYTCDEVIVISTLSE